MSKPNEADTARTALREFLSARLSPADQQRASKLVARYTAACIRQRLAKVKNVWVEMAEGLNALRRW